MQRFILEDQCAHPLAAAIVMRMQRGGRRNLHRAGEPINALTVDQGMIAFALQG